jgi:hypothetical protein
VFSRPADPTQSAPALAELTPSFLSRRGFALNPTAKMCKKNQKVSISGECAGWQKSGGVRIINCKVFPYEEPVSAQLPLGLNK